MSVHTIILLVLAYAALRAIFKRNPTDPMKGRLVSRPTPAASEIRSTNTWREALQRERDRVDTLRSQAYHADIAKRRVEFELKLGA